jgi:hypothetical protein
VNHIVLLGDSIFDNGRYVTGGPSVVEQLRARLPSGWRATLLARDGAAIGDVERQLEKLPDEATHLVLSVGGNDALDHSPLLLDEAEGLAEGSLLSHLSDGQAAFQKAYRHTLHSVLRRGRRTVVCTVYDSIPGMHRRERAGLCLFNDVILREAFQAHVPVIDLRLICTDSDDYSKSSPIEPSQVGGGKIARAICRVVTTDEFTAEESRVFI